MKKKIIALLLAFTMIFALTACGSKDAGDAGEAANDLASMSWDEIVEQAKGTNVAFYGWGGDENRNKIGRAHV